MRYVSLFSGIEAASCAWDGMGWEPAAFAEVDPFACAVLAHRFPEVPNLGDVTKIDWSRYRGKVDLVVGGSPCQSFSVAGKREGLKGESGLMFEFVRCVREVRPRWFLWENVPGALSSEGGEAFGCLLRELADGGGYGLAWRVLDAQFFGVAQRRRRLFLVGRAGDGFREACGVLFEPDCLSGDSAASRAKRQELAADARRRARGGDRARVAGSCAGNTAAAGSIGYEEGALCIQTSHTCATPPAVAFAQNQRDEVRLVGGDGRTAGALAARPGAKQQTYVCMTGDTGSTSGYPIGEPITMADLNANTAIGYDMVGTLKVGGDVPSACLRAPARRPSAADSQGGGMVVRRLTPRECERLQGLPDDWTKIPYRGKPADECPDGPRYRAIANSMAVPVMRWIGRRIETADATPAGKGEL